MTLRSSMSVLLVSVGLSLIPTVKAQSGRDPNQVNAKVERAALYLTQPDRYQVPVVVEPLRKVILMAPADGVLLQLLVPVGATVKEGQEIARLDPKGASARLKIAMAKTKEMQALFDATKAESSGNKSVLAVAEAHLDAARASQEIALMEVDACIMRAPFDGRVTSMSVSGGQYLSKGASILELADASSVRVPLPVDRNVAKVNGNINFTIEGAGVSGRVQALLPLPESLATLRELASPLALAWVVVANPEGTLEPGQRAASPHLPYSPIAAVPSYSIKRNEEGGSIVQVIRSERVTDVVIKTLGALGPDRTQVTGSFRPSDTLIQTSSVPLRAGTYIRFSDTMAASGGVEGVPPAANQVGESANLAVPATAGRPAAPARRPSAPAPPATKPGAGVVPF
jgi:multidrug efflux pump subunit AcrA (membrane-fusion protein)